MNADANAPRPMSRKQLRAVVYKIAMSYLEVERGLRPPEQLAAFLSPAEYRRHLNTPPPASAPGAGPVRPPDIARVRVDSTTPHRVRASALVRRADDRWSSLLVDLRQVGRGWQVTKLDRLEQLVQREPRHIEAPDQGQGLARRIHRVEDELGLAMAARDAVEKRIDDVGDRRTRAARELRPEVDRWSRRIEDLTAELGELDAIHRLWTRHDVSTKPQSVEPPLSTCGEEAALLGPRPEEPNHVKIWDNAVEAIGAFRHRWHVDEEEPVLGPVQSHEHAADQRQLLEHLRAAVKLLEDHAQGRQHDLGLPSAMPSQTMEL